MYFLKINGSLWCVFPKGHGVSYDAGHLRRAFVLFLNIRIMEKKINLVPLAEMLQIEGISADEMSVFFDELAHDYAQTVITLQIADLSPRNLLHEKTDSFLYLLRELRDVFRKCGA
jgi:hypothetical protein